MICCGHHQLRRDCQAIRQPPGRKVISDPVYVRAENVDDIEGGFLNNGDRMNEEEVYRRSMHRFSAVVRCLVVLGVLRGIIAVIEYY